MLKLGLYKVKDSKGIFREIRVIQIVKSKVILQNKKFRTIKYYLDNYKEFSDMGFIYSKKNNCLFEPNRNIEYEIIGRK